MKTIEIYINVAGLIVVMASVFVEPTLARFFVAFVGAFLSTTRVN